ELTLRFIVPAIRGVVGVWVLNTKGRASSVKNLRDSFDSVQAMRGTVTTSVFDLSVHFHKSNKPNQNSRYPVLELVCNDNRIGEIRASPPESAGALMYGETTILVPLAAANNAVQDAFNKIDAEDVNLLTVPSA
ncbi:hypothetical protein ACQUW0_27255, partial [Ralstonia pseudosolanacearum]|uniref:recombination directionality factor n=1 Tax=Ralstonia pseudosolanacearum TaxID=1310165 RepID=UPI003D17AF15